MLQNYNHMGAAGGGASGGDLAAAGRGSAARHWASGAGGSQQPGRARHTAPDQPRCHPGAPPARPARPPPAQGYALKHRFMRSS